MVRVGIFFCCVFFQAEDGIRDVAVTGVQTCALPICPSNTGIGWARSMTGGEPMEPENMTWVVTGKQYRTNKATLVAHDEYWNGYSCEQGGRNTFLFSTPKGAFFAQYQTLFPGEINRIVPLERGSPEISRPALNLRKINTRCGR